MSSLNGNDIVCSLKLVHRFTDEYLDESIDNIYTTFYSILKSIINITEFTNDDESLASQLITEIKICIRPGIDELEYVFVDDDDEEHVRNKIDMMADMILSSIHYRISYYHNNEDGIRRRKVIDGAIKSFLASNTFRPPRVNLF